MRVVVATCWSPIPTVLSCNPESALLFAGGSDLYTRDFPLGNGCCSGMHEALVPMCPCGSMMFLADGANGLLEHKFAVFEVDKAWENLCQAQPGIGTREGCEREPVLRLALVSLRRPKL